jgi:hypothetical protein
LRNGRGSSTVITVHGRQIGLSDHAFNRALHSAIPQRQGHARVQRLNKPPPLCEALSRTLQPLGHLSAKLLDQFELIRRQHGLLNSFEEIGSLCSKISDSLLDLGTTFRKQIDRKLACKIEIKKSRASHFLVLNQLLYHLKAIVDWELQPFLLCLIMIQRLPEFIRIGKQGD